MKSRQHLKRRYGTTNRTTTGRWSDPKSGPWPEPTSFHPPDARTWSSYVRMLLTHGARSVLRAAKVAQGTGKRIQGVRQWALEVQGRSNHNKATCALANKLARICYATLRDHKPF